MIGEAWVIAERRGDAVRRVSIEALGRLAALGLTPKAVVLGADVEAVAAAAAPYASAVLALTHPVLAEYSASLFARVLGDLAAARKPRAILAGATPWGRDLMARLAARLGAGYVADAVDLSLDPNGDLFAVRAILGGRAYAEVAFRGDGPRLASVRPNAFPAPTPGAPGAIEKVAVAADASPREKLAGRISALPTRVDISEADVVVTGGRGVRGPEGFAVVEKLAEAFGGAVGASRAAVDAGWRDHSIQVGKSGRTVAPKLYVALGVSGAVHHRMGMDTAKTVVVINSDPNAPFFKHADYGLVGDLFKIAPALAEEVRKARGT